MTALVIFDWDGTLIDSTARIVDCLVAAAQQTGAPLLSRDAYRGIIGLGLPEALRALYPDADDAALAELRRAYVANYLDEQRAASPLYPGAEALLDALRRRGLRLAVATGKSRIGLDRAFRSTGLGHYFTHTRTADETVSKPHPRMLQEILAEAALPPLQAVMVGDTSFDLEMARRAGVPAVGVTHGAHGAEALLACAPLCLVDDLDELATFLRQRQQAGTTEARA